MMGLGVQRLVGGLAVCLVAALVFGAQVAAADPVAQITEFSSGLNTGSVPVGVAAGADGNLWFTDESVTTPAVGRVTPAGTITEFSTGLNTGSIPGSITPGPDGNLWFTDLGSPTRRSGGSPRAGRSPSSQPG